jgi:signal transduction histidine kinase
MDILIAGDDPITRKILSNIIKTTGHKVVFAENGIEAWEHLRAKKTRILISDWMMPELDGPDLIKKIRDAEWPYYIYIILLTSKDLKSDAIKGLEAGADDYVIKPVHRDEMVARIRSGQRIIQQIVLDLKDFAHPGENELKYSDINKNINSTLNVVWNEIKYKAAVKKDYGELPLVKCYPQQLNQVFMNIMANAAQSIKKEGTIKIATRAENGHVMVTISDTGCGIPAENIPKIFDPFFTTNEVGKGTGLGLNVAYNIIKNITAQS